MKEILLKKAFWAMLVLSILVAISCKKYADIPPVFEVLNDSVGLQRKVLVISIDGAPGPEVKAAKLTNLTALQQTGKYSYDEIRVPVTNASDASAWATMLTGVQPNLHRIFDSTFQFTVDTSAVVSTHASVPYYPTIFDFSFQNKSEYETGMITTTPGLADYCKSASYKYAVANDGVVKDSAISLLSSKNDLGFLIVNFNEVEQAGKAGAFSISDPGYKAALEKIDGYIGNITEALKKRKNGDKENWLIMVTTNLGGSDIAPQPGFMVCSNSSFTQAEVKKNGFTTVLFSDTSTYAFVPDDKGLYDAKPGDEFTVQIQTKFISAPNYPGFLSKGTGKPEHPYLRGWLWVVADGFCEMNVGSRAVGEGTPGDGVGQKAGNLTGGWTTFTMVIKKETNGNRTMVGYRNGEKISSTNIGTRNMSNPQMPLRIGWKKVSDNAASFYAADLLYFNKALTGEVIKNTATLHDIPTHPNYADLIGYWPIDDAGGGVVANKVPGGYDMLLRGNYQWKKLDPDVPAGFAVSQTTDPSIVVRTTDVIANAVYWLKIKGNNTGSVSNSWLVNFEKDKK